MPEEKIIQKAVVVKKDLDEIKELIKENHELNKRIYSIAKKVNRHLFWAQIFSFLKILIFVIPIVLGILFLPKLLAPMLGQYQELLNMNTSVQGATKSIDTDSLLKILNK